MSVMAAAAAARTLEACRAQYTQPLPGRSMLDSHGCESSADYSVGCSSYPQHAMMHLAVLTNTIQQLTCLVDVINLELQVVAKCMQKSLASPYPASAAQPAQFWLQDA